MVEQLGAADGVLILDETGFLKKGRHSCGVASQHTGTTGDVRNAQVGVFLASASRHGAAFIDRALFLPRAWTADPARRAVAGVPSSVRFTTKIELAKRMLERAFMAEVPARWAVGDSFYGRSHAFRRWLDAHDRSYVLMVPSTNAVRHDGRRWQVAALVATLPDNAWTRVAVPQDVVAGEPHEWACLALAEPVAVGMRHWLLARRRLEEPADQPYYLAYGSADTRDDELVRVCQWRWAIEECVAQAKGEVGLDQYEVRTCTAWHRFVTLSLLAHATLVVTRLAAHGVDEQAKKGPPVFA